jgi:O-antigen/teichoic acid export membrane protein
MHYSGDKTMMARLSTLEAAGIYGVAYRLIEVVLIPVRVLLSASYPQFFRTGRAGWDSIAVYGRRLFLLVLPYSLLAVVALFLGASVVPRILGLGYGDVTGALRWLCFIPFLKTIQNFVANSLTGAGYQRSRTKAQVAVAIFNVLINLWAIPAYGWRGAAWSSLVSDGLLVVFLWAIAHRLMGTVSLLPETNSSLREMCLNSVGNRSWMFEPRLKDSIGVHEAMVESSSKLCVWGAKKPGR